jgi:4-amino-4-deoxy-L-arabinose transferase-like glycosyltransferase
MGALSVLQSEEVKRMTWIIVVSIVCLAAFLRFFRLHEIPPGLYPDEAMNGLNALRAIARADFRVFYPENNGREGLFINLQALAIAIFGASTWTLRAVSAFAGTITVVLLFFFSRTIGVSLFGGESAAQRSFLSRNDQLAMVSAFLLAVSSWHLTFSRIGFRAILLPLFSIAMFAALFRAIRTRKPSHYAIAGILSALPLYTYLAARILPLLVLPFLLFEMLRQPRDGSLLLKKMGAFALAFLITILPLAGYFVTHPEDLFGRTYGVSLFAAANPIAAFLTSLGKTLLMFHFRGDENWRHNVSGAPMLDWISGAFFLVGLAVLALRVLRATKGLAVSLFLLSWFGALLLPEILTVEGIPHALRAIGVLPPTMIIAAVGALTLWEKSRGRIPEPLKAAIASVVMVLILLMNVHRYFIAWAGNPHVPGAFRADLVAATEILKEHHDALRYVVVNEGGVPLETNGVPLPMPVATIRYLTSDDPAIHYLTEDHLTDIAPQFDQTIILTTQPPSVDLDTSLRALFPSIERTEERGITLYRL